MFPPKAYVPNPATPELPGWAVNAFEAEAWNSLYGAEYGASDVIFWMGLK